MTGTDLTECPLPLSDYESLQSFFVRELPSGVREIEAGVVSPVDGTLTEHGTVRAGGLLQAKGRRYSLEEFLGDGSLAAEFEGGEYLTYYLAPKNYHRVHSPIDGQYTEVRHLSGALLPVSMWSVNFFEGVFAKNERLILRFRLNNGGSCLLAMIGALHVGSMKLQVTDIPTNTLSELLCASHLECRSLMAPIEKGDLIGEFRFGSSVVLIFSPGSFAPASGSNGAEVRLGQRIGELLQ